MAKLIDSTIATKALETGRLAADSEFCARSVEWLPDCDAVEVITQGNGCFIIPRHLIGALRDVMPNDLGKMELWPDGSLIDIEHLDIHISVHGMIEASLPLLTPGRVISQPFAAQRSAAWSEAKSVSSRDDGKKS